MLFNEFLKEHRKVEEQAATINQLKSTATRQGTTIAQQRRDFQSLIINGPNNQITSEKKETKI